jgi:tryptophan synthase alpha chain
VERSFSITESSVVNSSWSSVTYGAVVKGGADMIEVGIPFFDPVAGGPVIQAAAKRALAAGVKVSGCMGLLANLRARFLHLPVGIQTRRPASAYRAGTMAYSVCRRVRS